MAHHTRHADSGPRHAANHASWDTFAAMSVVRRFAVAGLEEAAQRRRRGGMVVGAIDETRQEKADEATAGSNAWGCAGKAATDPGLAGPVSA